MEGDGDGPVWLVMVLYAIIAVTVFVSVHRFLLRRTARSYADILLNLYSSPSEYPVVTAADFPEADIRYYDDSRAALETAGFSFVADAGLPALARTTADPHTFARLMLSEDGAAIAFIFKTGYSLREKARRVSGQTRFTDEILFQVESTDGRFFEYYSTSGKAVLDSPPEVTTCFTRPLVGVVDAYAGFSRQYDAFRSETVGFVPKPMTDSDSVLASLRRRSMLAVEYRKAIGYVSEAELKRLGCWIFTGILAKMARTELRKRGLLGQNDTSGDGGSAM